MEWNHLACASCWENTSGGRVELLKMVVECRPVRANPCCYCGEIKVVHILLEGFPLCGFDLRVPGDWPEGHAWTSFLEPACATCAQCKNIDAVFS